MGGFYGNITLYGPGQQAVAEALRGRRAIVAPQVGNHTIVFDSVCDEQDTDAMQALTSRLSREFHCPALALVVHDDDVMIYDLFDDGALIDSYSSNPSYFHFNSTLPPAAPTGGIAGQLCRAFDANDPRQVEAILRTPPLDGEYVFETERHAALALSLSIPAFAVGTALASFDRGEYPEGLSAQQMLRAADPPPVEDRQRRLDRMFYDRLGPEDPSQPCKRAGCGRGVVPNSVLCKRHHFEMIQQRDCPFDH
jgi:hypothetical protein